MAGSVAVRQSRAPAAARATTARPAPRPAALPMGLPLTGLHLARLARLEQLVGPRYRGWCELPDGQGYAVDVLERDVQLEDLRADGRLEGVERFTGKTLHLAIGAALRALGGR